MCPSRGVMRRGSRAWGVKQPESRRREQVEMVTQTTDLAVVLVTARSTKTNLARAAVSGRSFQAWRLPRPVGSRE